MLLTDVCGFHICDSNADCTPEKQCRCRSSLGFSGGGSTCRFSKSPWRIRYLSSHNKFVSDPCTPGFHNCRRDADCVVRGRSFVCAQGVSPRRLDNAFGNESSGPCDPGAHDCHINATCYITIDLSYTCSCNRGHFGDGKFCIGIFGFGTYPECC